MAFKNMLPIRVTSHYSFYECLTTCKRSIQELKHAKDIDNLLFQDTFSKPRHT